MSSVKLQLSRAIRRLRALRTGDEETDDDPWSAMASVGALVEHRRLGSTAVYRVIASSGSLVELEVVDVPGLPAGQQVKVTREAAEQMRRLPPA